MRVFEVEKFFHRVYNYICLQNRASNVCETIKYIEIWNNLIKVTRSNSLFKSIISQYNLFS